MIRKILVIIVLICICVIVVACDNTTSNVVFSKVYQISPIKNNVIELYNNSKEDEDLSKYYIGIFGNCAKEVTKKINLTGTINAFSFFTISSNDTDISVFASKPANYVHNDLLTYFGKDGLGLFKNNKLIDMFGYNNGLEVRYHQNTAMFRLGLKETWSPSLVFSPYNFITYQPESYQYLGNDTYEIKTIDDIMDGPRLETRYLSMPYVDPNKTNLGGGGALLSTLVSIADGDTARFSNIEFANGSVRYYYINTPEVASGTTSAEPWGYVASKFNKEFQLKDASAKTLHVQSIPGSSIADTYSRYLGLVWINGYLSQFLVVREGLTVAVPQSYDSSDMGLTYKDVPYLTFLRFAEKHAKDKGWGIWGYPLNQQGEKSPDWNYTQNTNTTSNPMWTPHFPLPWL